MTSVGCLLYLVATGSTFLAAAEPAVDRHAVAAAAVQRDERMWREIATADPRPTYGSRSIFAYALVLAEAGQHPERLGRLWDLAQRMQDRDPDSKGYGNLKWYWRDPGVTDYNAVEFCMQDAMVVWHNHRAWVPEPARAQLEGLMKLAVEGCLRHQVATSYTNIAVLNAANLIVLGETFQRPDAAQEGYRRLDDLCRWTWAFGIHEYCSPTYYSVDFSGLQFVAALAAQERGRRQAAALLALLWNDVAANWYPPAEKLAGTQSRTYDYLHGLGGLDVHLARVGWLAPERAPSVLPGSDVLQALLHDRPPPPGLREVSARLPRLVRQSWGPEAGQSRTLQAYADVALGTSGAAYGSQDMTLTVDLPGDRQLPRCYFIPDGREDPYGIKKYPTGGAGHMKALHLLPFWAGAQRAGDALGLVIYRPKDVQSSEVTNLESHFVLRRPSDGLWLAGQKADLPRGTLKEPRRLAVKPGDALVLRYGTAGVAIRLLWTRSQDGRPAPAALVDDGNPHGVLRLTVEHRAETDRGQAPSVEAGAALWVRVGSGLADEAAFDAWRGRFEQAQPKPIEIGEKAIGLEVPGAGGPVAVSAGAPWGAGPVSLVPAPYRGPLEVDGQEIGRPLLEDIEPIAALPADRSPRRPIAVPARGGVAWEAEDAFGIPPIPVAEDAKASGGRYLCQPPGPKRGYGQALWLLEVPKSGPYYLWARTRCDDQDTDSFYVRVLDGGQGSALGEWHLERGPDWKWQPLVLNRAKKVTPLELSAGRCWLEIRPREAGARLDRMFLTPDAKARPE